MVHVVKSPFKTRQGINYCSVCPKMDNFFSTFHVDAVLNIIPSKLKCYLCVFCGVFCICYGLACRLLNCCAMHLLDELLM